MNKSLKGFLIAILTIVVIYVVGEIISVHTPLFIENYLNQLNARSTEKIKAEIRISAHASNQLPKDYLSLFNHLSPINKEKLKFDETQIFNFRYPVSNFTYKEIYFLQLYKIGYVGKSSLESIIIQNNQDLKPRNNISYTDNQQGLFNFLYNPYTRSNLSVIYFSIKGINTHNIALNDTIAYYYANLEKLAITFSKYESQDLFIEGNFSGVSYGNLNKSKLEYTDPAPFALLFLKYHGNLYLIMLSTKDPKAKLNPNMLLDLLNGKNED